MKRRFGGTLFDISVAHLGMLQGLIPARLNWRQVDANHFGRRKFVRDCTSQPCLPERRMAHERGGPYPQLPRFPCRCRCRALFVGCAVEFDTVRHFDSDRKRGGAYPACLCTVLIIPSTMTCRCEWKIIPCSSSSFGSTCGWSAPGNGIEERSKLHLHKSRADMPGRCGHSRRHTNR